MKKVPTFEEFVNESTQVHYYGPDSETEKRAGLAADAPFRGLGRIWKNGDGFKSDLKSKYLKNDLNKLSDGKVTIKPGNHHRLVFNTTTSFDEKEVRNIFNSFIERWEKVNSAKLILSEFTTNSFVVEYER